MVGTRPPDRLSVLLLELAHRDLARLSAAVPIADASEIALAGFKIAWCAAAIGDEETLRKGLAEAARFTGIGAIADEGEDVAVGTTHVPDGCGFVGPQLVLDGLAAATLVRDEEALARLSMPGLAEAARKRAEDREVVIGGESVWPLVVELYRAALTRQPLPDGLDARALDAMQDMNSPLDPASMAATVAPLLPVIVAQVQGDEAAWQAAVANAYALHEAYTSLPDVASLGILTFPMRLCALVSSAMTELGWTPRLPLPQIIRNLVAAPSGVRG